MAITKLFERYSFPGVPKLDTVLQDFRRKTNELIDYFLGADFGNLRLYDTDQSDLLNIKWNEDDSNSYTLNLKVNSGNRTIDLSGNLTVESASVINSDLSTDANWATSGTLGSGKLTVDSGADCSIIIKGTSTGDTNVGWIGFYDSNGTTRRGSIGDGSINDDDIYIGADTGYLRLYATAGYIGLGTHTYLPDDVVMSFGSSLDYSIGYYSTDGEFQIVNGSTLDSNVRLKLDSSGHFDFGAGNLTTTGTLGSGNFTATGNILSYKASQGTNITVNADADQNANIAWQTAGSAEWQMYRPAGSVDLRLNEYGVADQFAFGAGGNFGIGVTAWGDDAIRVLGIGESTAPTTSPGDMVQLWSADRATGYAFLQYRAEGGIARNFDVVYNVKDFGAKGDGSTDDTATIQAALDNATAGSAVYFPPTANYYKLVTNDLDVDTNSITLLGDGAGSKIQQTSANVGIFNIDKSDVSIIGLNLVGSGQGATGGTAIDISGADKDNYLSNIKVIDTDISLCARGITCNFIEQFEFRGGKIIDMERTGILLLSCQDGFIHDYYIEDVQGNNNADYGIAITRTVGAEATYPTSKRIKVDTVIIKDVTYWEGFDTHGGERIDYINCTAINCDRGFVHTDDSDTGNTIHVPIDCNIIGCTTDSTSDAGDRAYGILFNGSADDTTIRATGSVIGNTVRRHGYVAGGGEHVGGIRVSVTEGVLVEGNTLIECVSSGIVIYGNNYGFTATGNTVVDLWSNSTGANEVRGISVSYGNNLGYIGENSFSKSGTFTAPANGTSIYFDSANGSGVYVGDAAGNDILVGVNYSEATTWLSDAGGKVTAGTIKDLTISSPSSIYSLDHDSFANYVGDEHIDHTLVSISGGGILTGGGAITGNQTISLAHGGVDHDQTTNYAANKHVVLPGTIANVLSDHTLAGHVTLGLLSATSGVNLLIEHASTPTITMRDTDYATAQVITAHGGGAMTIGLLGNYAIEFLPDHGVKMSNLKSGANQGAASAAADELWIDTADQTIKVGT